MIPITKSAPKKTFQLFPITILTFTLLSFQIQTSLSLNSDGTSLLAFKYSILNDPLSVLLNWDYLDPTPCSWTGVTCSDYFTVVSLSLPNSQLLGSIPPELSLLQNLQHLDLSNNLFNGTLPSSILNSSQLQFLSLSSNVISGELPDFNSGVKSALTFLNLSDNAFGGSLPGKLSSLKNLTVLSLKGNYFSGDIPSGFGGGSLGVLDLSSNLFNGSLPSDLGGPSLKYLNLSYNKISGLIPPDFAAGVPENAKVDLSFNNLTGQIPGSKTLLSQDPKFYWGNDELCGKPLKNLCIIPSTLSTPPNVSASISPAIAVMPKSVGPNPVQKSSSGAANVRSNGLKPVTIVGITLADLAGVGVLGLVLLYLYQVRNKKQQKSQNPDDKMGNPPGKKGGAVGNGKDHILVQINKNVEGSNKHTKCLSYCLRGDESEDGATSDARTSSDTEDRDNDDNHDEKGANREKGGSGGGGGSNGGVGSLVMVDGETELEVDTLLKASAYILGSSGSSIVYKAVLQDGTTFAVRRLEEIGFEKLRDFEGQVKAIGKLRHRNLVRVRGFYWSCDEKLVIYDYVSNGSLATSAYKKNGSTPHHLPLEARLKIARGVARGLTYIHDKRFIHGNIKPSNILLTSNMEPIISDLGLSWLVYGNHSSKGGGMARQFGSKRSMGSFDVAHDQSVSGSPYINPFSSTNGAVSPYQAPESMKNLKPNPKWDVYSFGIVLLELLTGKVHLDRELVQWTPSYGLEDRYWVLRVADVALRAEIQGKEAAVMGIFKLGFNCASLVPQKRPSMKEALQVLEKVPLSLGQ